MKKRKTNDEVLKIPQEKKRLLKTNRQSYVKDVWGSKEREAAEDLELFRSNKGKRYNREVLHIRNLKLGPWTQIVGYYSTNERLAPNEKKKKSKLKKEKEFIW